MRKHWLLVGIVVAVGAIFGSATAVMAHADYVRSEPALGQTVATVPPRVVIVFSQQLDLSMSNITVFGPSGEVVSLGSAKALPGDAKAMYVDLKDGLGPGQYVVRWANMSAEDGEHASGQFSFQVGTAASLPSGGSGTPLGTGLLAGLVLASTGAVLTLVGRRGFSVQRDD